VSPTNINTKWCEQYLFDYNNLDKTRLMTIIGPYEEVLWTGIKTFNYYTTNNNKNILLL